MFAGDELTVDLVLEQLSVRDRSLITTTCRSLYEAVARVDGRCEKLVLEDAGMLPPLKRFGSLRELVLGSAATGWHLKALDEETLPLLAILDVSGSSHVTDAAIGDLYCARIESGLEELKCIMCDRVSYNATLLLRKNWRQTADRECAVTRLPEWLVGSFETPWGETHVYYADGSFQFDRAEQSKGYVHTLRDATPPGEVEVLADSLQYVDYAMPLPPPFRNAYRPGVLARSVEGDPQSVYVAQRLRALVAPSIAPAGMPWAAAQLGQQIFSRGPLYSDQETDHLFGDEGPEFMISRMPITRHERSLLLSQPPAELVAEITAFHEKNDPHSAHEARRLTEMLEVALGW